MADSEMKVFIEEQTKAMQLIMNTLFEFRNKAATDPAIPNVQVETTSTMEALSKSITVFTFDPQNGTVFTSWYARFEEVFTVDGAHLDDASKTRLLLRKLDNAAHAKYMNFILPKKTNEINFKDTVAILETIFGETE